MNKISQLYHQTKSSQYNYPQLVAKNQLKGKTAVISGGSRGIGLAIGKALSREGCNVVILAKTVKEHPKLPGTIFTAQKEIEEHGGKCLAL